MKSSIKVDFIDRGTGRGSEPLIRVEQISSEDPRDTLLKSMFESIQYSRFLEIYYTAAPPSEHEQHNRILVFKPNEDIEKQLQVVWNFFRQWLGSKKYTYTTNKPSPKKNIAQEVYEPYYEYGDKEFSQTELFNKFVDENQPVVENK